MDRIASIRGREILNAKGQPTVEAELITENGICVTASVPSGTSRGKYEAFELYDGEKRYGGYGTRKAAGHVSGIICDALKGMELGDQKAIDQVLLSLDGTSDKSNLGGNAILAASVAAAKAGALSQKMEPYEYLRQENVLFKIPDIVATVIAGGVFSSSGMEFEDYMMLLHGFDSFPDELEALCSMRKKLEVMLKEKYGNFPEDGGALAAPLSSSEEAFDWILKAAQAFGFREKVTIGIDVAASELWDEQLKVYKLENGKQYEKDELCAYYQKLCENYPLTLIEDGFEQDDFGSFSQLKNKLPGIQIVGDDLFVTNTERLKKGIELGAANAILLKINQIGTVSEAIEASNLARKNGMDVIVSLRSGETADDFIADLAVAAGARQIKLGSPVRLERNVKYNRLLNIWQKLNR